MEWFIGQTRKGSIWLQTEIPLKTETQIQRIMINLSANPKNKEKY